MGIKYFTLLQYSNYFDFLDKDLKSKTWSAEGKSWYFHPTKKEVTKSILWIHFGIEPFQMENKSLVDVSLQPLFTPWGLYFSLWRFTTSCISMLKSSSPAQ